MSDKSNNDDNNKKEKKKIYIVTEDIDLVDSMQYNFDDFDNSGWYPRFYLSRDAEEGE